MYSNMRIFITYKVRVLCVHNTILIKVKMIKTLPIEHIDFENLSDGVR